MEDGAISGAGSGPSHTRTVPSSRQYALAGAGVLLVGIGAVGVVVPGLPTTIFLLGASWCFARSIPWLEQRMLRNRFFAPYMRILDGDEPMTNRARVTTIITIWLAVSLSCWLLHRSGRLSTWLFAVLIVAALIGSVVVWHFRRSVAAAKQQEPADPS